MHPQPLIQLILFMRVLPSFAQHGLNWSLGNPNKVEGVIFTWVAALLTKNGRTQRVGFKPRALVWYYRSRVLAKYIVGITGYFLHASRSTHIPILCCLSSFAEKTTLF